MGGAFTLRTCLLRGIEGWSWKLNWNWILQFKFLDFFGSPEIQFELQTQLHGIDVNAKVCLSIL